MPSPFPGMDPYIEASGEWGDFHTSLLVATRAQLNALLPRRYRAKIDVFVFIQEPARPGRRRYLEPDVFVIERPHRPKPLGRVSTLPAPATIVLPAPKRRRHRSVLIVDRQMNRVVTALEILSPSNKEGGAERNAYLAKRSEYLANGVSLVELDLLRGGMRFPLGDGAAQIGDYDVMVCRAWEFPRADIWTFTLRNPLPPVPIPLVPDAPETRLPFRACVDRAYDEGSYDTELDYERPLMPRPRKGDAAWIREIVAGRLTK